MKKMSARTVTALIASSTCVVAAGAWGAVSSGPIRAADISQNYRISSGSSITLPGAPLGSGSVGPTHTVQMPVNASGVLQRGTSALGSLTPAGSGPKNLGSFNIVINPNATLAGNAPALAAFNRAANQWKAFISDPITVTVDAGLDVLGPGIIGSTSSVILQDSYTPIRDAQVGDADPDDGILNSLPTVGQFLGTVPAGRTFDGTLIATKANLKAIGYTGLDDPPAAGGFGPSDGDITFSTTFSFDFDNSNGVTPGTLDFETVAAHEIGHLLGFFSAVDDVDFGANPIAPSTLDMLRFRNLAGSKPTNAATFTTSPRNFVPGADDITSDVATENRMSTGINGGDGNQASHWKADDITGLYVGIMDPTLANGQIELITAADRRAMDLIGYDITVPEPSMLAIIPIAGLMLRRRSQRGA